MRALGFEPKKEEIKKKGLSEYFEDFLVPTQKTLEIKIPHFLFIYTLKSKGMIICSHNGAKRIFLKYILILILVR